MKLALIGYGKMGKMIEQIARERGHEIVSIIDIDNQEEFESEDPSHIYIVGFWTTGSSAVYISEVYAFAAFRSSGTHIHL